MADLPDPAKQAFIRAAVPGSEAAPRPHDFLFTPSYCELFGDGRLRFHLKNQPHITVTFQMDRGLDRALGTELLIRARLAAPPPPSKPPSAFARIFKRKQS